jgi:hypothetical protein
MSERWQDRDCLKQDYRSTGLHLSDGCLQRAGYCEEVRDAIWVAIQGRASVVFVASDEIAMLITASGPKAIFIGAMNRLLPGAVSS